MTETWCSDNKTVLRNKANRLECEVPRFKRKKRTQNENLCEICGQNVQDPQVKIFKGLADATLEEEAALTDNRLLIHCEDDGTLDFDYKPIYKITHYTVFDGEGHLCSFDTGLIENDQLIFFSGYIKPIYDDDPSPKNGVPVQELGPILEWWISGFDGGNSFLIAFATPYAEYVLVDPSPEYMSFMRLPKQKALLTKIVIEFLSEVSKPTFEDLKSRIEEISVPDDIEPLSDNSLRDHAQFIVDQIVDIDEKKKLMSTPAVQDLIKMYKVNVRSSGNGKRKFKNLFKPTTTPLVRRHFQFFFEQDKKINKTDTRLGFPCFYKKLSEFSWEPNSEFAVVNGEEICRGDFVCVRTSDVLNQDRMFRVEYFFEQSFTKQVHCIELIRGSKTILGEASDPNEFFFIDECSDWPICKIMGKVKVKVRKTPETWSEFFDYGENPTDIFFVQKKYNQRHGGFEKLTANEERCSVCAEKDKMKKKNTGIPFGEKSEAGIVVHDKIIWENEEYSPGCCVFVEPFAVVFDAQKSSRRIEKTLVTLKTDEMIYPEIYRKAKEVSLMEECPEPFVVAYIKNIFSRRDGLKKKLFLTINKFYRPENTRVMEPWDERLLDFQRLYWSQEETEILFEHVRGRCDVVYSTTPLPMGVSTMFYFNSAFDSETETFYDIEEIPLKRRDKNSTAPRKLKTLNAFSGCGGLAEGLRQSGVADILWAVENEKSTATAYKLNFPTVVMFEKDCNLFLKDVLHGKTTDENGISYPKRGEVEFLCGGPPCQGFSTMNRFTSKEESQYNNSLILTFLSFCDYYRPKYFLLENVRNFAGYKKSAFLKHSLSSLNAMGYQCIFGVMQAGNYGLPQTRRRLFILAAAPCVPLPHFPKPTHVFHGSLKNIECEINGAVYTCRASKTLSGSAPYRKMTIRDAIFDLPRITPKQLKNNVSDTFYKKFLMGSSKMIYDHQSKEMNPINEARIKHIPAHKNCDWRDLPNIRVRLRDGSITDFLKYSHHDKKNGKSSCGLLRGVCGCASGKPCDPNERQNNTLIPWFLVHTANRNNNWSGLYGRLDWQGVFNTVTTNPEPSSQQGKVLHPEEDRTISVRECARAQGLPDSFKLFGSVQEKFRQVGNAVPAPVARAIGREIIKSLSSES